jgi:hypothetical protein
MACWPAASRRRVRRQIITDALSVLAVLPDPGTGLARLASRVLGDAHALDEGTVQAAVLRALSGLAGMKPGASGAAHRRKLWEARESHPTLSHRPSWCSVSSFPADGQRSPRAQPNAEAGQPARLTLGQVSNYLDAELVSGRPSALWRVRLRNPSVAETAADTLGPRSGPLICADGRPSVAAGLLFQVTTGVHGCAARDLNPEPAD